MERVSEITTSPTAWSPAYEAATDADDTRVPETAEGFMSLIAGITGTLYVVCITLKCIHVPYIVAPNYRNTLVRCM